MKKWAWGLQRKYASLKKQEFSSVALVFRRCLYKNGGERGLQAAHTCTAYTSEMLWSGLLLKNGPNRSKNGFGSYKENMHTCTLLKKQEFSRVALVLRRYL